MENIIKRNETITGKTLAKEIRENVSEPKLISFLISSLSKLARYVFHSARNNATKKAGTNFR